MSTQPTEPIAIIGMACRFAGSDGLGPFWDNLVAGRDCVTRDPSLTTEGDSRRVGAWGLYENRNSFDSELLGFPPIDPEQDLQHGFLSEVLWSAVEDAGLRVSEIGPRTALYAGSSPAKVVENTSIEEMMGMDARFAANRFSYLRNLQHESLMLEAGCATSLVAAHMACMSLRAGSCDYALAAGVSVMETDGAYDYVPGGVYSSDGVCRPFDKNATGTVPGDGAAAVLLRRLDDALRDGDPIHAVIRSSAVGNDGKDKAGYSIPGVPGKIRVIRQALDLAGLTGAEVGYMETHGVGIPLNDEIEATALTEGLGPYGRPLAVGSVKASVGHTSHAAGLAGLIKTALVLKHGFLPATPNTADPIDTLTKGGDRYSIVPEGRNWEDDGRPRVAGVMAAGFGGTNSFAILQEAPARV
ncbi:polyketide synthase [Streptomyces sp. NPDC002825]|uniref:beta-ketoacyl [acyl carrier protein] synthase domain-containing protein n=1 Tax=Streptomyces sp. NPDC002825 TaxID=3154666 RepID=UPI00333314F3